MQSYGRPSKGTGMTATTMMGSGGRRLAMLVAAVSLSALVLQYVLLIRLTLDTVGPAFATVKYFSYFTEPVGTSTNSPIT